MVAGANGKLPGAPFNPETLRQDCLAGRHQLWLVRRDGALLGLGVTGILTEGKARTLVLMLVAGQDWPAWQHLLAGIEDFGRCEGCSTLRFLGRRGWSRRLPGFAITPALNRKGLIFERTLRHG